MRKLLFAPVLLSLLSFAAPAEAQPAPKCKVVSVELAYAVYDNGTLEVVRTTKKCRGKTIVTDVRYNPNLVILP